MSESFFQPRSGTLFNTLTLTLLCVLLSTTGVAGTLDGYRGANFGMSPDSLRDYLAESPKHIGSEQDLNGDGLIVDAHDPDTDTDLRYVFAGDGRGLALIIAFHPEVDRLERVRNELEGRLGAPWDEELAEEWLEQLRDDMPPGIEGLTVWGGQQNYRHRFVRLWEYGDYLSVEYLDLQRLNP